MCSLLELFGESGYLFPSFLKQSFSTGDILSQQHHHLSIRVHVSHS